MGIYEALKPLLFRLEPERAHGLGATTLDGLAALPGAARLSAALADSDPLLACTRWGIDFANPVGLAAGFDKDGAHIDGLALLGFGFLELGTVTPEPQTGNPHPRLFRLPEDQALINRMGFNNAGAAALAERLHKRSRRPLPLGLNLGKQKTTPNEDAAADYRRCVRLLAPYADYIVINISSPNTPGLRELSRREPLKALLDAVSNELRAQGSKAPLLVKLSPDEDAAGLEAAVGAALDAAVDGIIATNTTTERPHLRSHHANETGGLSGAPLKERANATMRTIYRLSQGRIPLIGVGGIATGADAYTRIKAGASLVQLYTSLIYGGPGHVRAVTGELARLLSQDGLASLDAAVGVEA